MPIYSSFSPITMQQRQQLMQSSIVAGIYDTEIDRESAYERLQQKVEELAQQQQAELEAKEQAKIQAEQEKLAVQQAKEQQRLQREQEKAEQQRSKANQDLMTTVAKTAVKALGSRTGQSIVRGLLGSLFGGKK